jgi:hypothetical protein
MERKTEHFFDGDKLSMTKLMNQLAQHPQDMEKILKYVYEKVEHFTEFNVKKEHLKEDYDNALQDLYAKYMQ